MIQVRKPGDHGTLADDPALHIARVGRRVPLKLGFPPVIWLLQVRRHVQPPRHPLHRVHCQMETVKAIQHRHVEGRRRGALLVEAAHMEVVVVGPTVSQPGIAVIGEGHRRALGEHAVELGV